MFARVRKIERYGERENKRDGRERKQERWLERK
jgi:hypothetical protein